MNTGEPNDAIGLPCCGELSQTCHEDTSGSTDFTNPIMDESAVTLYMSPKIVCPMDSSVALPMEATAPQDLLQDISMVGPYLLSM